MKTPHLPAKITESRDLELSGGINRAASEGAKFALLLAMLQHNVTERPSLSDTSAEHTIAPDLAVTSSYPKQALKPATEDWLKLDSTKRMLHESPQDAMLHQVMHPQPLSLFNDALRIDDVVAFNCDYYAQQRLKHQANSAAGEVDSSQMTVDETGLYDVLQELDVQPSYAA